MKKAVMSNENLLDLVNAIRWLIDECDTNYLFADDLEGTEYQALENLREKVYNIEKILRLETEKDN